MQRAILILLLLIQSCFALCQVNLFKDDLPDICLQRTTLNITEVMVHDVASPPVAARFYAYSLLSGYIAAKTIDNTLPDILSVLKENSLRNHSLNGDNADLELTCLYAILQTAKKLLPSSYLLEQRQQELVNNFRMKNINKDSADASLQLAVSIADKVVEWAKKDGYFSLSSLPRYITKEGAGYWQPTPPAYMQPVEPNWQTIKTFFIDSSSQFKIEEPVAFNTNQTSAFYELCHEVYTVSKTLTDEKKIIANYWDCNPFALSMMGHVSVASKKISPGGHWINIIGQVCRQNKLSLSKSLFIHSVIAMGMHDAFVSCWHQKYLTNRIRPQTVITDIIDANWQPLLQTPPFPEYTSGHSVLSTMAAELMTQFLGDNVIFKDNTGVNFEMPERTFTSFKMAADEACISRLYGGIHFRDAIENGMKEGKAIGVYIINRLNLKRL